MENIGDQYTLTFDPRPDHLYVFAKGNLAVPAICVHAWSRIIERCRSGNHSRLLVVQDSPVNSTPADAYTSSAAVTALGLEGIKIAFADLDPLHFDNNKFAELVGSNRGAFAKVFTTEDEARNWLLADRSGSA